jgi:hypothetical protein
MRKAVKPTSIHSVPPFFGASSAQEVLERRPAGEWHSIVLTQGAEIFSRTDRGNILPTEWQQARRRQRTRCGTRLALDHLLGQLTLQRKPLFVWTQTAVQRSRTDVVHLRLERCECCVECSIQLRQSDAAGWSCRPHLSRWPHVSHRSRMARWSRWPHVSHRSRMSRWPRWPHWACSTSGTCWSGQWRDGSLYRWNYDRS